MYKKYKNYAIFATDRTKSQTFNLTQYNGYNFQQGTGNACISNQKASTICRCSQEGRHKSISFESASTFDLDVDIKISVDGNTAVNQHGMHHNVPISFKVPKKQAEEAREIVKLVKKYYLSK